MVQGLGGPGREAGFLLRVREASEGFCLLKGKSLWILIEGEWTGGWIRMEMEAIAGNAWTFPHFSRSLSPAFLDCLRAAPSLRQNSFVLKVLVQIQTTK